MLSGSSSTSVGGSGSETGSLASLRALCFGAYVVLSSTKDFAMLNAQGKCKLNTRSEVPSLVKRHHTQNLRLKRQGVGMEARMSICNMSIEAGAHAGVIAPDELTFSVIIRFPLKAKVGIALLLTGKHSTDPMPSLISKSAVYYFNSIDRMSGPGYMSSDQDILRSRVKTTGITETTFKVGELTYKL
ncbi:G protein alpha-subunit [Lentinula edodes]|uniref:G protein alpha-subunit n=1 Tax=Lentinula edodes TaxID=5353 RepID=A0A1Q3DVF9_LENED|nr:G protein alpha-subunit [Lentinula edodes]